MYGKAQLTQKWYQELVNLLLQMTHEQWIFRNSHVHFEKLDGMTEAHPDVIMSKVHNLLATDPDDLLEKHQHMLHRDFEQLGKGSMGYRKQ